MFSQMKQSIFISSSIHRWWLTPVAIEGIFCFNIATSICCVCAGTTVVRLFSSLRVFLSNCDSDVFAKYSVVFPPEYVRLQLLSTWHKPRPLTTRCFTRIKLNEQRTRRIRLLFFSVFRWHQEVFMADFCSIFDGLHSNLWSNCSQLMWRTCESFRYRKPDRWYFASLRSETMMFFTRESERHAAEEYAKNVIYLSDAAEGAQPPPTN